MSSGGGSVQRADGRLLTQAVHITSTADQQVVCDQRVLHLSRLTQTRMNCARGVLAVFGDDRRIVP